MQSLQISEEAHFAEESLYLIVACCPHNTRRMCLGLLFSGLMEWIEVQTEQALCLHSMGVKTAAIGRISLEWDFRHDATAQRKSAHGSALSEVHGWKPTHREGTQRPSVWTALSHAN